MHSWHFEDKVTGMTNQLLLAILRELETINKTNKYAEWKRQEIVTLVSKYEDRPKGFTQMKTEELIKFLLSKE